MLLILKMCAKYRFVLKSAATHLSKLYLLYLWFDENSNGFTR